MSAQDDIKDLIASSGLEEFETGSGISLSPFEEDSSILLDEHPLETYQDGMLEELDATLDKIHFDGMLGNLEDDGESEETEDIPEETEVPDEEPVEEPVEVEEELTESPVENLPAEEIEDDDDTIEIGAEDQYIEREFPPEHEPVEHESDKPLVPVNPVIGFVCEHAMDLTGVVDASDKMFDRPIVRLISVPCAGMVKPSWLKHALDNRASGVFIVSCAPGTCHHRTGADICTERWEMKRRPMVLRACDRRRMRKLDFFKVAGQDNLIALDNFLLELGRLDAGPTK
jgi:coenzyme F420-reducing hydrogenase delta subunit